MKSEKSEAGFTLPMAFMDMLPVAFFSIGIAAAASAFGSRLFQAGAFLVISAGALKVCWKFLLAVMKKDVRILSRQMRFLMPAGFILMACALAADRERWSPGGVMMHILSFPAGLFFLLAAAGILCMAYFAGHFDQMDAKSNWIEQGTNAAVQLFFMLGILL